MSKLTISPIVRSIGFGHQGFDTLFGKLITKLIYVETGLPITFENKPVTEIIKVARYNAIRALIVENEWIWLDQYDNIVGRTPEPLVYEFEKTKKKSGQPPRHLWSNEILEDQKFMICKNKIYDSSFENYYELMAVHAGTYLFGTFVAYSPSTILDVSARRIIWINPNCVLMEGGNFAGERIAHIAGGRIFVYAAQGMKYIEIVPKQPKNKQRKECIVCLEIPQRIMTYGCGHAIVCVDCHGKLKEIDGKKKCPECQTLIDIAIPTFP